MTRYGRQGRTQILGMPLRHAEKTAERPRDRRHGLHLSKRVVPNLSEQETQQNSGYRFTDLSLRNWKLELGIDQVAHVADARIRPLVGPSHGGSGLTPRIVSANALGCGSG